MIRFSHDEKPNVEQYAEFLSKRNYVYVDKEFLMQAYFELLALSRTNQEIALNIIQQASKRSINTLSKQGVLTYLMDIEHCPEHYFVTGRTQSYSLSTKDVLEKLHANGYAMEFLDAYMGMASADARVSKLRRMLAACTPEAKVGQNSSGCTIYKIPFNVNVQQNLRFNYKNFDILSQIPKDKANCLTVPEGYCLAWGDFAQSDFRIAYNLFLRSKENDEYMKKYDDKYEALARIAANTMGVGFNYDEFKRDRSLYKVFVLETMYGTRSSRVPEENRVIRALTDFLNKCPRYLQYYNSLQDRIDLGLDVKVTSYFGYEQIVTKEWNSNKTLFKCLNTPIQTGTSEIIILTVTKILNEFYSRGWTEDDIGVYIVRHDEPVFWMKKEVMKDSWIFKKFSEILVDDWSALAMDFDFGFSYKDVDQGLTDQFTQSIESNKNLLNDLTPAYAGKEYFPVSKVLGLEVYHQSVADKTIVSFLWENKYHFMCINATDQDTIIPLIKSEVRKLTKQATANGFNGIIVEWDYANSSDSWEGHYIKYAESVVSRASLAGLSCRRMCDSFCKSKGIPYEETIFTQDEKNKLISLQEWSWFNG